MNPKENIPELEPYEDEYSPELRRIEQLAHLLDGQFLVPGTQFRVGWDGLIGLIPGIGDTLTLLPQLYLVFVARRLNLGNELLIKMLLNVLIDWLVGLIPVLGDLFDIVFKSNYRNAKLVAEAIRKIRVIRDGDC
jgi:hypothetical protein